MINRFSEINWFQLFQSVTGSLTALAAIATAIAALIGLSTWRKQIIKKAEFDLARRFLITVYEIRLTIENVRRPFQTDEERSEATKSVEEEDLFIKEKITERLIHKKVYYNRRRELQNAYSSLNGILLEAEGFWGKEINIKVQILSISISTLSIAITTHLMSYDHPEILDKEKTEENKRIISYNFDFREKDEFKGQVDFAVKEIEDFLRPKLKM